MFLFIILYSLFFLLLASKNLKWAVYLVCFSLPAYLLRFSVWGIPMTVLEMEILVLFLVWIIKTLKHENIKTNIATPLSLRDTSPSEGEDKDIPSFRRRGASQQVSGVVVKQRFFFLSIILFLLTSTVSVFVSPDLRAAAGIWRAYFLEPLLFFIVFVKTVKKEDLKNVFLAITGSAFLLSVFAIYQKFTGAFISNHFWAEAATRRVTSFFPYPNALALFLAPVVVILIGLLVSKVRQKNIVWWFNLISFIVGFFAVYFTKSKGAILAILAGLIFYAIFFRGHRKVFVGILTVAFLSFFLLFLFSSNNLANTLKGTSTVAGGDSISTRLDMWSETWQMLKTRPVLGAGLAGYQSAVAPFHQKSYIEIYLYPHNIFLNFWSEIGLFGLLAFLGVLIWFYRMGMKNGDDKISIILMAGMTALIVHGLVDVPYFKNDLSVLFWIVIGAMVVLTKTETKE